MSHANWVGLRLAVALVVGVGLWSVNSPKFVRLAKHGRRGSAIVTSTDCSRHDSFNYRVVLDEPDAEPPAGGRFVPADCRRLREGDRIDVYYLPNDPTVSTARDPRSALFGESLFAVMAALLSAAGARPLLAQYLGDADDSRASAPCIVP